MPSESPSTPTALLGALVAAQLAVQPVPKRSEMDAGKFGYMYASAADVVRYAKRHLHQHGLAVVINSTDTIPGEGARGVVILSGVVFHQESGEVWPVNFSLPYVGTKGRPDDKASQASISTGEARAYRLLLGLTTEDAEDEVANRPNEEADRQAPAAPRPPTAAKPPAPESKPAPEQAKAPAASAPPKAAAPAAAPAPKPAFRPAEPEASETPIGTVETFATLAKRLGLDLDTAVTWSSREPFQRPDGGGLSRMKDGPKPRFYNYADALDGGKLPELLPLLETEIESLKSRKIHPRQSGWSDRVKRWSADAVNF